ncbi:multidrug efflux system outer membrane protein [Idiomarina aquatica]|uniref:Multidrug efflux system outer membrane protein n=1 Tax=Idiomarina aquatica TaxID=1327752 RepID=A0A4R6NWY3_9GAMM|nr:efflux transporter outer membrane subunit [Idiomarina aquatica]TDP28181.1 multidrug efflux system outer membrane protein [Idiomarina aquatica]
MHKTLVAAVIALALSACTMGPNYQHQQIAVEDDWPEQVEQSNRLAKNWQDWWTQFNDPTLNALVEHALDENLELQLQLQRIEQARAQLGLSDAEFWPSLGGQAEATRQQQPRAILPIEIGGGAPRNEFTVAGTLSYEIDLWGRLRREREAANAQLDESVYGLEAVRLSIIGEVVSTYFNLRSLEQQQALAEETLASYLESLHVIELRYRSGAEDALGVRQARAAAASARAILPDLQEAAETTRSALAILVGFSAQELTQVFDFGDTKLTDLKLPDALPRLMPSELLQRRPDVRAAESYLIAANAQVGAAQASRWPSLNLSGLIGSSALQTSDLFEGAAQSWSIGGNLAGPILDFGRGRANVENAEALKAQAEIEYQMAVTSAFRDTRDALSMHRYAQKRVEAIQNQVKAIGQAVEMAEFQYDAGAIGIFELLNSRRELLQAKLTLSEAYAQRLLASANLFKAMGGGWQDPQPSTLTNQEGGES